MSAAIDALIIHSGACLATSIAGACLLGAVMYAERVTHWRRDAERDRQLADTEESLRDAHLHAAGRALPTARVHALFAASDIRVSWPACTLLRINGSRTRA